QLEVTLNNYFVKYNATSTNTVQIDNNKLIVKGFEYFTSVIIQNTNLNNLKTNIQNYIKNSSLKFTSEQFKQQINLPTFKSNVASYLGVNVNAIGNIEFANNTLTINPNTNYKFVLSTDNTPINDSGVITVSNLDFYNVYNVINLENLYNGINDYIAQSNNQFTVEQFVDNVNSSQDSIKEIIANNLQLSNGNTTSNITTNNIESVSFINEENIKQLEITLAIDYYKYEIESNDNVTLEGNKVIISNLKFYQEISFNDSDLTTLRDNIQNLIDENEVNSNNISSYLSNQIYDLVKNINTVENGSLEQYVVEPTYLDDSIKISLKSDVGYYKFKTSSFTNISITSNQIS
ncbi:MAG: hypothetical protein K2L64_02555, partial [Ureaplasma sp.]|nr:hypothetical protein [Ureaplasma sp.]